MRFCTQCGNPIEDGMSFCTKCGAPIKITADQSASPKQVSLKKTVQLSKETNPGRQGTSIPVNNRFSQGGPEPVGSVNPQMAQRTPNRKSIELPVIIGTIIAIVAIAAIVAVILFMLFQQKDQASETAEPNIAQTTEDSSAEAEPSAEVKDSADVSEETAVEEKTEEPEVMPVTDDTAIHNYEIVIQDVNWAEAQVQAQARGGYLVRINSPQEFDHIRNLLAGGNYSSFHFYLGGKRADGSMDYHWVKEDGTVFDEVINVSDSWYAPYWFEGEPTFQDVAAVEEHGVVVENAMSLFCVKGTWLLNDTTDDLLRDYPGLFEGKTGFIVEY